MGTSSKAIAEILGKIAGGQGGFFTATQALEAGYNDSVHGYHVKTGDWIKAQRGIYRLSGMPESEWAEFFMWSLWTRDRSGKSLGVFCRESALFLHWQGEKPQKFYISVPKSFRKSCEMPKNVVLYKETISEDEKEQKNGIFLTKIGKTLSDLGKNSEKTQKTENFSEISAKNSKKSDILAVFSKKHTEITTKREKIDDFERMLLAGED